MTGTRVFAGALRHKPKCYYLIKYAGTQKIELGLKPILRIFNVLQNLTRMHLSRKFRYRKEIMYLLAFFWFQQPVTFAQVVFEKGYVINTKGDTVRGDVKLNISDTAEYFDKVVFKDEKGQKNYLPEKIKAYGVGRRNFVSIKLHGETGFYEVLARGHVKFYRRMLEAIKMNELAVETEYYIAVGDKKPYVLLPTKFKKQLASVMEDNTQFITQYSEKDFNMKKIAETISAYNNWKGQKKQ
jgi:hypothetical protein